MLAKETTVLVSGDFVLVLCCSQEAQLGRGEAQGSVLVPLLSPNSHT